MSNPVCLTLSADISLESPAGLDDMLTRDMSFYQSWYRIEDQFFDINPSQPLLNSSTGMSNDLYDFFHKDMVGSDVRIPDLNEVLDHDRNDCIEL